jgi:general secretion pathway protein C
MGRIIPAQDAKGRARGIRLASVRAGGLYALIGLQDGDLVEAVNGHPITSPEKLLPLFAQLRTASHVTIAFTRRGRTISHDYTIR